MLKSKRLLEDINSIKKLDNQAAEATIGGQYFDWYQVEYGDTLWEIAEEHYGIGWGKLYSVLWYANQDSISNPDKIYAGSWLRIPHLSVFG